MLQNGTFEYGFTGSTIHFANNNLSIISVNKSNVMSQRASFKATPT